MLNSGQIHGSVRRILSFFPHLNPEQVASYEESLRGALGWMDPGLFEKACIELVKTLDTRSLPQPQKYKAFYEIMKDREPKKSNYTPPTMEESTEWCLTMVATKYTPGMAKRLLEKIDSGSIRSVWIAREVLEALRQKAAQYDGTIPEEAGKVDWDSEITKAGNSVQYVQSVQGDVTTGQESERAAIAEAGCDDPIGEREAIQGEERFEPGKPDDIPF